MLVRARDGMKAHLGTGPHDSRIYDGDFRYPEGDERAGEPETIDLPDRVIFNRSGKAGAAIVHADGSDIEDMPEDKAKKMYEKWDAEIKEAAKPKPKKKGPPPATFAAPKAKPPSTVPEGPA